MTASTTGIPRPGGATARTMTMTTMVSSSSPRALSTGGGIPRLRLLPPRVVTGRLVKKRKFNNLMSLAIKEVVVQVQQEGPPQRDGHQQQQRQPLSSRPTLIFVPKTDPALAWCHESSWIQVEVDHDIVGEDEGGVYQRQQEEEDNYDHKDDKTSTVQRKETTHTMGTNLTLIKCAPNPSIIPEVLERVTAGEVPLSVFSNFCESLQHGWQIDSILEASPRDRDRKKTIAQLCRELSDDGTSAYGNGTAERLTHVKKRHLQVLTKMEHNIDVVVDPMMVLNVEEKERAKEGDEEQEEEFVPSNSSSSITNTDSSSETNNGTTTTTTNNNNNTVTLPAVVNIPDNDVTIPSHRHPRTRVEYLQDKKWPQIDWLLQRLKRLDAFQKTKRNGTAVVSVLDIGGGRGDIACAIAKEFSQAHITVVDQNETSLKAGKEYARRMGLVDRITFVCADFETYAHDYHRHHAAAVTTARRVETNDDNVDNVDPRSITMFDLVVAWHACGDLSDIGLQFAHDIQASYVICPCCYTKRYMKAFSPSWISNYLSGNDITRREVSTTTETSTNSPVNSEDNCTNNSSTTLCKDYHPSRDEEIAILQKLAETNDRPDISRRAMTIINKMRIHSLCNGPWNDVVGGGERDHQTDVEKVHHQQLQQRMQVGLESYSLACSSKNLVLVGEPIVVGDPETMPLEE